MIIKMFNVMVIGHIVFLLNKTSICLGLVLCSEIYLVVLLHLVLALKVAQLGYNQYF